MTLIVTDLLGPESFLRDTWLERCTGNDGVMALF